MPALLNTAIITGVNTIAKPIWTATNSEATPKATSMMIASPLSPERGNAARGILVWTPRPSTCALSRTLARG